ncbi:exonuclease, putative [Talaromyces stipitatus ATCC 10500]|uniref:RNA exonuclease 4 n=1 Tax=Talaromyces stipitatus (strain ATCC 10500 / CBS 375.48 / QM 6759 / NRRL 1006) TaxID=441959 RepID=B8M2Q7_TALSN|nr:exonuclease, putative [Talaromyces stipitatus ATCC 10500]EED21968.1 exonuclease, putative [Talaromyces stipitatus ATCC 10500]
MDVKSLSSNWKKLQASLKGPTVSKEKKDTQPQNGLKRKRVEMVTEKTASRPRKFSKVKSMIDSNGAKSMGEEGHRSLGTTEQPAPEITEKKQAREGKVNEGLNETAEIGKYVAMDCEMVGVGPDPDKESALARVSIVNWNGDQVYDSFVRPKEKVTDWRTHVSGIAPKHMLEARSFEEVQKDVAHILEDTVLVGHSIRNDLEALMLSHPKRDIRDTSKYPPYRKIAGGSSPRLKLLASELLGLKIQEGAHSSVEDARATMLLFRRDKEGFEKEHAKKWPVRVTTVVTEEEQMVKTKKKRKPKKKSRKR